ncbi:MAG: IS1595 family transposase, partial [Geminicoccaceae bacterium]
HDKAPGRLRLKVIDDYPAKTLGAFVHTNLVAGSTAISDGWSGYLKLKEVKHEPKVVGSMAAHVMLPWIHCVFGNAKRWAMGAYHGLRETHLQRYLDEFVFRFNRRRTPQAALASLLGIAVKRDHASYQMLIQQS